MVKQTTSVSALMMFTSRKYFLSLFRDIFNSQGDIVSYKILGKKSYFLKHPDHIKHVLLDNHSNYVKGDQFKFLKPLGGDGVASVGPHEQWKQQRHAVSLAFRNKKLDDYSKVIVNLAAALVSQLQTMANEHKPANITFAMEKLSFDVIINTIMKINENNATTTQDLYKNINAVFKYLEKHLMPIDRLLSLLPSREKRHYLHSLENINDFFYSIIDKHLNNTQPNGFLEMLMPFYNEHTGAYRTRQNLRDELATILTAGYETVSTLMTWVWVLLSKYPEAERRLSEELKSVLNGRLPTYDDLPKLNFTRCLIQETLRLYPPAWLSFRKAVNADKIGDYSISKNADMYLFTYFMHRHPQFWINPEGFDPERFVVEHPPELKHIFCPFGVGPRICIGSNFAMMEAQLIVATIAQHCYLELLPGSSVETIPTLTLKPGELIMKVRMKDSKHQLR